MALALLPAEPHSRFHLRGCSWSIVQTTYLKQLAVKHRVFGALNFSLRAPDDVKLRSFPARPARCGRGCRRGAGGQRWWYVALVCMEGPREVTGGPGVFKGSDAVLCLCGVMNFAAALRGEAAPEEGIALGQRGAGPGAAASCACPAGHRLPRSSAPRAAPVPPSGRVAGPGTAGAVRPSVSAWFEERPACESQTLGVTARDRGDARAMTARNRAWKRRYLE